MVSGEARTRRTSFAWLNATQFLGALNDNIFKLFLVYFLIATRGEQAAAGAGAVGLLLLAVPFLLFSAAAGNLADRVSKRAVVVGAKVAEIAVMLLGFGAFAAGSPIGLYAVMFLMATQSTFFSPVKYGIVPELVGRERLSRANGLLQACTYLAIIFGTVLAPILSRATSRNYALASLFCVLTAVAGALTSLGIERTAPAGSTRQASWFFLRDIWRTLKRISADRYLLLAVIAAAYFLMLGAYLQFNLIPYSLQELGLSQEEGSFLFMFAAFGIGFGSLLAGRWSGRNVELGVVPMGAAGLTVTALLLGAAWREIGLVRVLVFLMGTGAGLFIVPIQAWIQFRSPDAERGEIQAASGFLSWIGVIVAAGLIHLFSNVLHLSARQGFLAMGWLTLALTVVTLKILPDFLLRFLGVLITRLCYRLRVIGPEHVPVDGPALLVCNHVGWMDAMLLMATQQRRIRFLAYRKIYEKRWLNPLMRLMQVIPVSEEDPPKRIVRAIQEARAALDAGYLVCIFAEGALTRTGNLLSFKAGFQRIVKDSAHPIIPVYLGGAWGSIFSYAHGQPLSRWPLSFPYSVTVIFGKALPSTVSAADLRGTVLELSCDYFDDKKPHRRPLGQELVRAARRNWSRPAMADTSGKRLTFGKTLTGALALAAALRDRDAGREHVGILLPPCVAAALTNLAVSLLNRVPVNLNYTASPEALRSAIRQCEMPMVITSRDFLQKLGGLPPPEGAVYVEDLLAGLNGAAKARAWLRARFLPTRLLVPDAGFNADRVATIIFSSGSTGEPKGVMLSHHNILSNVESLRMVFQQRPADALCAVLPFFHSFGFMATLWYPLLSGFPAVYHSNPLDGTKVAEVVRDFKATLLFATPSFLLAYLRRATREDFASLRLVVVGAEKLKARLADAFQEKFGIRPLEGYGATELAPVATLNVPDVAMPGIRQVGTKEGTVGHPVPGVAIRIVDPESGAPLPVGQTGLMLVRGPNVMLGYLRQPEKTAEVLRDGWYNTGDIARLDADGFVTITDRLSRFSKIGGEMVPHIGVEEALYRGLNKTGLFLAVSAVPDERKGEKLVVLYTDEAGPADELRRLMAASDLPNLWKPSPNRYFRIESLPLLGSGKLDLKALKQAALALAAEEPV